MSDDKKPLVDAKSTPSTPSPRQRLPPTSDINELHARFRADPRFNPPTPSVWTRLALIVLVFVLLWLGVSMRKEMARPPEEVQAKQALRYSKEHKYRPAASPVITETLADGRVQVKGAVPTLRIY